MRRTIVEHIKIFEAGIYATKVTGIKQARDVATGKIDLVSDIVLLHKTTTVPAKVGTSFAIRYRKIGGESAKLKFVILYPLPGLQDPRVGNTSLFDEYPEQERFIGITDYFAGYTLENDWELVHGTWTFELWQDDRKLAGQSFTLVKSE